MQIALHLFLGSRTRISGRDRCVILQRNVNIVDINAKGNMIPGMTIVLFKCATGARDICTSFYKCTTNEAVRDEWDWIAYVGHRIRKFSIYLTTYIMSVSRKRSKAYDDPDGFPLPGAGPRPMTSSMRSRAPPIGWVSFAGIDSYGAHGCEWIGAVERAHCQ